MKGSPDVLKSSKNVVPSKTLSAKYVMRLNNELDMLMVLSVLLPCFPLQRS